jgi:hypothetical protein
LVQLYNGRRIEEERVLKAGDVYSLKDGVKLQIIKAEYDTLELFRVKAKLSKKLG